MVTKQIGTFWRVEYEPVTFMFTHPRLKATPLISPAIDGIAITLELDAVKETRHSYNGEAVYFDLFPFAEQAFSEIGNPIATRPMAQDSTTKNPCREIVEVKVTTDETTDEVQLGFIFGYALPGQYGADKLTDNRYLEVWENLPFLLEIPATGEDGDAINLGFYVDGKLITYAELTPSQSDIIEATRFIFNTHNRLALMYMGEIDLVLDAGNNFMISISPAGIHEEAGNSQNVHIQVMSCAPDVYVRWLDEYGRINFAGLSIKQETNATSFAKLYDTSGNSSEFTQEASTSGNSFKAGYLPTETEQEVSNVKTLQCYKTGLRQKELDSVKSLLQANFVDMYLGEKHWQSIKVVGGTTTFKRGDVVQDFAVTFDVSNIKYPHK